MRWPLQRGITHLWLVSLGPVSVKTSSCFLRSDSISFILASVARSSGVMSLLRTLNDPCRGYFTLILLCFLDWFEELSNFYHSLYNFSSKKKQPEVFRLRVGLIQVRDFNLRTLLFASFFSTLRICGSRRIRLIPKFGSPSFFWIPY